MWDKLGGFILRKRLYILILLSVFTLIMGVIASKVEMTYQFAKLLPSSDSTLIEYEKFKETFGEDGNVFVIGIQEEDLFSLEKFSAWYELGEKIKKMNGVDEVMSVAHIYNLKRNDSLKKFDLAPLIQSTPTTQVEVDSLKEEILNLPFYTRILLNDTTMATMMAISMDPKTLNSKDRDGLVLSIKDTIETHVAGKGMEVHYSGLPFIRTNVSTKVAAELKLFLVLAVLILALILFLIFRSFSVVIFSILVVATGVVLSLGTVVLFGYKITILLGLVPPLIIVIGIPNCVFLLNKYHQEYKKHGNQARALTRVIQKIGGATFLTNMTTALGFATFIFTRSSILVEFGVVASINIILVFFLSLLLIPTIFSYLPPPKARHTKHLDNPYVQKLINKLVHIVSGYRNYVYVFTVIIVAVSIFGILKIRTTGSVADDIPHNDPVFTDLKFFEYHFGGVMPFEVRIDTKKDGMASQLPTLQKIDRLQKVLSSYPELSRPLSLTEVVKFSKQSFYGGDPLKYTLPNNFEKSFLAPYLTGQSGGEHGDLLLSFIDSAKRVARVSVQMKDIGTEEMERVRDDLRPRIDSIFNPEKYDVLLTGNSVVFIKGTNYLVDNLITSLALAIMVIAILMSFLFMNFRMVIISLVPNLVPLIVTAGLMGYFGITIKPSTILIFSIAFGISVDDTIHYLAKYRQEIRHRSWDLKGSVLAALREAGISMTYTSIILFFGFGIFAASNFGGTVALGVLISITLLFAMLTNLVLLPSLLLTMEKHIAIKAFKEPLWQIFDEEEDLELEDLKLARVEDTFTDQEVK